MADKTTYDSEINQPTHRPGMEGVVNRTLVGAGGVKTGQMAQHARAVTPNDAGDQDGNRVGARRTVSAPTRSAFGEDSHSDPAPKSAPEPAAPKSDPLSIVGTTRDAQYSKTVDDATK